MNNVSIINLQRMSPIFLKIICLNKRLCPPLWVAMAVSESQMYSFMIKLVGEYFSHMKECIGMEFPLKSLIEVSYQFINSKHYWNKFLFAHLFFYHLSKYQSMAMLNTNLRNLTRSTIFL